MAKTPSSKSVLFRDPKASIDARVNDLIRQLTLKEKIGFLCHRTPGVERLGIPPYVWWSECLHGVGRAGRATVFPQSIGLAATFNSALVRKIGDAIALEARAKHNEAKKLNNRLMYTGLTFWTPNINIFRDPRWGRGHETYGEDPFLTATLGKAMVLGMQGEDKKSLKLAACAKHYAVHSGPEPLRHVFDAKVDSYDLWNTYLPAFEALVTEAKAESVMGAYNLTNAQPCCAHPYLIKEVLRGKW
jgi:beta-glucosidase